MYIDESGVDKKKNRFLILATLICHEKHWKTIDKKVVDLKLKYFDNSNINLKIIRRWRHDPKRIFEKLSEDDKKRLDIDLYDILNDECLEYMSAVIDRKKCIIKMRNSILN